MFDWAVCKWWCLVGIGFFVLLNLKIILWIRGATAKSKEFEEYHGIGEYGYCFGPGNGNSLEKELQALRKLGSQIPPNQSGELANGL